MRTGISRRISRRRQRYESNGNEKLQKIRFSGLSVTGKYTQRYRRAGKIRIQTAFVAYNTAPVRRKAEKCDVRRGIRIPFIANSAGVLIPRPYARGALHRRHGGIRRKAPGSNGIVHALCTGGKSARPPAGNGCARRTPHARPAEKASAVCGQPSIRCLSSRKRRFAVRRAKKDAKKRTDARLSFLQPVRRYAKPSVCENPYGRNAKAR